MKAIHSYSLAVLSGILLLLSLPPFKLGGFLGWFAFVPILIAVFYETRAKRISRLAMIAGAGAIPLAIGFAWWVPDIIAMLTPLGHLFWLWFIIGIAFFVFLGAELYADYPQDYWELKQRSSKKLQYLPSSLRIFIGIEYPRVDANWPGLWFLVGC